MRAVHQSDERMDKNPKKKKRVKIVRCSSVDVMDSSRAAPEDRDKPPSSSSSPSSSSGKRRFKGLRRFFGRMLSFCRVSLSSEQDKTSSIQTQKTRNISRAVGRSSEELQEVDLLTDDEEKEAVGGYRRFHTHLLHSFRVSCLKHQVFLALCISDCSGSTPIIVCVINMSSQQ